jgi:hypothetical protein
MVKLLPYLPVYPGDYLRSPLAGCSLGAQGLGLRMKFLMHDSRRYGYLCDQDGVPLTPEATARACGASLETYHSLLPELVNVGVVQCTCDGILFMPELLRLEEQRTKSRKRQQRHRARGAPPEVAPAPASRVEAVTPMSQGISSSISTSNKKQNPAGKSAPAAQRGLFDPKELEDRRKVEARDRRLVAEASVHREAMAGAGPGSVFRCRDCGDTFATHGDYCAHECRKKASL